MRILAFDTSANACSAAVWRDGAVAAQVGETMDRGHTEALMPMIHAVLHDAEAGFDTIDWLAVTIGPGSFTGIRAGLAAARGIAMAREIPVLGVDAFAVVLRGMRRVGPDDQARHRIVALESRRKELYFQMFSALDAPLSEPELVVPEDAAARMGDHPVLLAGSAADRLSEASASAEIDVVTIAGIGAPDARDLAAVAADRIAELPGDAALPALAPLYLHPPYAVRPAGGGRLRP